MRLGEDLPTEENAPPAGERPVRSRQSAWLWLVSAIAAALFLGLGSLYLFGKVAHVLALLVLAVTVAVALAPLVESLTRKLPRLASVLIVYIVLLAVVSGFALVIVPVLVAQAKDLGARLPTLIDQVQDWLVIPSQWPVPSLGEILSNSLGSIGAAIVTLPIAMLNSLLDFSLVLFISLYWLLLSPQMMRYVLALYPAQRREQVAQILQRVGQSMGGYLRASVINGIIMGILTYIGLIIIGVPFPAVLSLLMGILEVIPALGPTIAGFFIVAVALLQSPQMALIALIFVIVLQQAEGNILVPNIMRRETQISPLLVILALLAGSTIGGLLGAFVAIPIAAASNVIVDALIAPAIKRWTGSASEPVE